MSKFEARVASEPIRSWILLSPTLAARTPRVFDICQNLETFSLHTPPAKFQSRSVTKLMSFFLGDFLYQELTNYSVRSSFDFSFY